MSAVRAFGTAANDSAAASAHAAARRLDRTMVLLPGSVFGLSRGAILRDGTGARRLAPPVRATAAGGVRTAAARPARQFSRTPSTVRGTPAGLSSRSSAGSSAWGAFWYVTGRSQRSIAVPPTDVEVDVAAG